MPVRQMFDDERSPERDWGYVLLGRTGKRLRWTLLQSEQLPMDHFSRSIPIAKLRKRAAHAARRRNQANRSQSKHSQEQQDRLQILPAAQQDRCNSHHCANRESINGEAQNRGEEGQRSYGIGKTLNMVGVLIEKERAAACNRDLLDTADRLLSPLDHQGKALFSNASRLTQTF